MAFTDEPITKEPCVPKQKNPFVRCRCEEVQRALNNVAFSYTGTQCMRIVADEICKFCIKESGR